MRHLNSKLGRRLLGLAALALAWSVSAAATAADVFQPVARGPANSVVLAGPQAVQRLPVLRRYGLDEIRATHQVMLGTSRLDFSRMLADPKALFNVAQRLQAMPQLVEVREQSSDISEIAQGLVIHHVLTFRVLPGKCADPQARSAIMAAGAACTSRTTPAEAIAGFSQPGNFRYVADPGRRQAAIAAYQRNEALINADATQHIAQLRRALTDPAQRGQMVAAVGEAETQRMASLSDDDLKQEVIDSGVQHFEQTMFVPRNPSTRYAHPTFPLSAASPSMAEIAAGQQAMRTVFPASGASVAGFPKMARTISPSVFRNLGGVSPVRTDQVTDLDLGDYIFLTGFTVANDYEWNMGVSVTINWCLVGCSSTYDVNLYAGFNYAFGLRFPIDAHLKYHNVVHPDGSAQATLNAAVRPIEGTAAQFESTGLDQNLIFDGKELVAQIGANAGFNYNLPVLGSGGDGFQVGVDFTNFLPAPYTGGTFQPPAPGTGGIDTPYVIDSIDLLGGLLNFGALGGQVFPAVDINLHSDKLTLTLNDEVTQRQTVLGQANVTAPVGVDRGVNNDSHFSLGNPVYNLGFTLTPGLDARLFIDLAVWSDHWDWPVWFPQLAVELPPGGVDFACHADTTCVLDFRPEFQAKTGMTSGQLTKVEDTADQILQRGGCQRQNGQEGQYLCPGQGGMLGLCQTMQKNGSVLSCTLLVPSFIDQILTRGKCVRLGGGPGNYGCPSGMIGLCNVYVGNKVINSCKLFP